YYRADVHRHLAWRRATDDVSTRQLRRVVALSGKQRCQARVHALDVVMGQRRHQDRVDVVEDVVDVGTRGRGVGEIEVPVGVGGADDPMTAPGDDEQHRLLGAHDQAGLGVDPVARDDDVYALARTYPEPPARAGQVLQLVGPHARRVDDDVAFDVLLLAGLDVANLDPADPVCLAQKPDDLRGRTNHGAVVRGRSGH